MVMSLLQTGLRPREPRIAVMIASRMRVGNGWSDVRIHNISSRGMLLAGEDAPAIGTYIEIRRGTQIVIGRVMWAKDRFFGIRSQEKLPVQAIINEPRLTSRPQVAKQDGLAEGERRDRRRLVTEHMLAHHAERSRTIAWLFQFGVFACFGIGATGWAAVAIYRLLAAQSQQIGNALIG